VNRTLARGQVSITIKNTATFPISWYLLDADTEINGIRAARVDYPSAKFKLLPGSSVRISDGVIDMDNIDCQHLLGKMNFKIRYGLPGKEHFELKFLANLNVPMERFGFVPSTITEWLA
jgi:hypothetical protein